VNETSRLEGGPPCPPRSLADARFSQTRARAEALIEFCNGLEECGWVGFARRGRVVASELLDVLDMLAAERSVRVAYQARCEKLQGIIGKAAYRACVEATRGC
jgi:hypothetical protein